MDECVNESLKNLHIEYFDLYLLHYPKAIAYGGLHNLLPKDEQGNLIKDEGCDYVDAWRSVQKVRGDGRARSLGVSNFNGFQLERLIRETGIVPTVNQVEFHPYLTQPDLVNLCRLHRIAVTAYCCVGAADRKAREWKNKQDEFVYLLEDPVIVKIADKHGKSPAQVCLRFCVEMEVAAVPKSVTASRITENLNVFDFQLSGEDLELILSLNRNHRFLPADADKDHITRFVKTTLNKYTFFI